ncbi:PilN domain-containing protein [Pontiella sp.]|uniref:PilN domain-containing protein n=1 Tax=Pontiella sp. TaxID=2837462 RepID=UPI003568FFD6
MSMPRVNLLRKSEQRHQGLVSRRFSMIIAVVTPILLIAVLSGIKVMQYSAVQSELKTSQSIWAELEPKLELYKEENRGLVTNRKVLDLFGQWKASRGAVLRLLDEVQDAVPANIQLTRLSYRGEFQAAIYAAPEDLAIRYAFSIDGISQSERAESDVIGLRKELLGQNQMSSMFTSLKLASLRKRGGGVGAGVSEFRLVGETDEGGAQ